MGSDKYVELAPINVPIMVVPVNFLEHGNCTGETIRTERLRKRMKKKTLKFIEMDLH